MTVVILGSTMVLIAGYPFVVVYDLSLILYSVPLGLSYLKSSRNINNQVKWIFNVMAIIHALKWWSALFYSSTTYPSGNLYCVILVGFGTVFTVS